MTVEDLLSDNVHAFCLQEELVRNSECDSWKEIPVKVDDVSTSTTGSDQHVQAEDKHKQNDDVTDADDRDEVAAAGPTPPRQAEPQLSGK